MNLSKAGKIWQKSYKRIKKSRWLLPASIAVEIILIFFFAAPLLLRTPVPFIRIKSDSMLPVLKTGDFVITSNIQDVQVGDIIAFYNPIQGRIIVHRAIDKEDDCFMTKGDNAQTADFFRPCKSQILGKIIKK